jgi:UDP-glucuronate 4-epimerase
LPTTGLRFFTVYGPWGRPDMAPMLFARAMLAGEPIQIFNHGQMRRDFTYIDDIVDGVVASLDHIPQPDGAFNREQPDPGTSWAPYRVFNIGHSEPVALMDFVDTLEAALGVKAIKDFRPMQPGDVPATFADTARLAGVTGIHPTTHLRDGVAHFANWYREYHTGV